MTFSLGREEGFPTLYAPNKTSVTVDVLEAGLILAFVILATCFYIVMLGLRGKRLLAAFLRITISLFFGACIIIGNFGQEWEVGHIKTNTSYKAGTGQEIEANINVKIGLRSVNVTLKADSPKGTVLERETIDYNERFEWTWDQSRFGSDPNAGFREAHNRGLPYPILWIVDYFVFDGEGLRFGRFYRTAGWYALIAMWIAFPCWLLANILFLSVIRYGVNFLAIAGLLQLLACIVWGFVRNSIELSIPFEAGSLTLKFGSSFYLTFIGGLLCCIIAVIIFLFNLFLPFETAAFFGIDPLTDYDEFYLSPSEVEVLRNKNKVDVMLMEDIPNISPIPNDNIEKDIVLLKRRSTIRFGRRNVYGRHQSEDGRIYFNMPLLETAKEDIPIHPSTSGLQRKIPPIPPKRIIKQ